jgi:hypothetical protein
MDSIVYSTDTLTVIASIAIAIAGFSGVVVALTGKSTGDFSRVERLNLRILIQVSSLALFFSLLPLILHRAFEPAAAWRISMLFYGAAHLADTTFFVLRTRSSKARSRLQKLTPLIGFGMALSQLIIGTLGSIVLVEVVYLFVLVWHLAIAGMGFINLVSASRDAGAG